MRTAHSNSLMTEITCISEPLFWRLNSSTHEAVLVKEMPTDAYKVRFPLENRSDRLLQCLFNHRQHHNSPLLKAELSRGSVTEKAAGLSNRNEEWSSLWRRSKAAGRRCSTQTSALAQAERVVPVQPPADQLLCFCQVLLLIPSWLPAPRGSRRKVTLLLSHLVVGTGQSGLGRVWPAKTVYTNLMYKEELQQVLFKATFSLMESNMELRGWS